ncbi:hypothetical protein, partial [Lactococcus cremoris]|uniref:hypothetical protein n=1 Tax=Lactococcus lactis subsp. cremoris TaxID=1359 RepID=UPI001C27575F
VAFLHVFVLCLNYTIVTLRFKDNIIVIKNIKVEYKGKTTNSNPLTFSNSNECLDNLKAK